MIPRPRVTIYPVEIYLYRLTVAALLLAALAGCQSNPVATAETSGQRAFAVLGLYQILAEEAVEFVRDPDVNIQRRRAVQEAIAEARPIRRDLTLAFREYEAIRAEFAAGETTEDRVLIAARGLETWILRLEPVIDRLVANLGD